MSKTIPIWTSVLNCAIKDFHDSNGCDEHARNSDCSLHLPLWVPQMEKASIEEWLQEWILQLKTSGADIASLAALLRKPLCPLWISQKIVIWLNEVLHHDSWDFTPIILVSASSSISIIQHKTTFEFSWNYIPGARDDEESWA